MWCPEPRRENGLDQRRHGLHLLQLEKREQPPDEASMKLLVKPSKPKWSGTAAVVFRPGFRVKASWQRFIDNIYWNTELEKQ